MDSHKKHLKRSSILKLQTEAGLVEGHEDCAAYLEQQVAELLGHPALFDQAASDVLLREVDKVFTDEDNQKFHCPAWLMSRRECLHLTC